MDLWTLGENPISSDQPAGADIRYDPEFEELQSELDKLSSPSAAGAVDWEKVVQMASGLLANKSKDLWVASTLAVALIYIRQAEGLAMGLRVYRDLLTHFWETLYPPKKRIRGRFQTIEWWLEKTGFALASLEAVSLPAEQINAMRGDFEAIDRVLAEYPDQAPSTASIREFLRAITPAPPEPGSEIEGQALVEPTPKEAKAVGAREISSQEAEVVGEITSLREAQGELNGGLQRIRRVAAYLRQEDGSAPLPYRLHRICAWLQIQELPPVTDGRTRLPPPDPQVQKVLSGLRENGDWENLLEAAEPKISQYLFWLDLNHYVAEALSQLGTQYQAAENAVREETARFIHRLPGLEALSFSDGTPFADSETKGWLREIALVGGSSGEALSVLAVGSEPGQENIAIQSEQDHARKLLKEGKLFEAVDLLQKQLQNSFSRRQRLLWRLALSQLLMHSKSARLLWSHLEEILHDVDRYQLEEWDPSLALNALKVVWFGFNTQRDEAAKERGTEVLNRIAKLDLNEAIRLEKGK
jgi:type VI secretion system protein VasJ